MITTLAIEPLTAERFEPFGTVIPPSDGSAPFGPDDAELRLDQGTPRFLTMRIPGRGLRVERITRHRRVTQVLASAGGHEWVMAVAPPGDVADDGAEPTVAEIRAFRIPGDTAIMLATGTWHAGPLFDGDERSFFNLELSDTNVTDHQTCDLVATHGIALQLA
ncbi:MAG: ureidoglycolate lyase [Actinomycetota bacterium]